MAEKKPYLKVSRPDSHGSQFCVWPWGTDVIENEMDGMEIGDTITVELVEMTEEEFRDLGEFEGW